MESERSFVDGKLRFRGRRSSQGDQNQPERSQQSLKLAFKHEVRPEEYLFRVWITAIIAAGYFSYVAASKSGQFDLSLLVPLGGSWPRT